MRFDQLKQFLVLGHLRHFRQAAEQTGISTSALTRSIQTLEDQVGYRLVARSTRSVELTAEGEVFLQFCQHSLDELERTLTQMHQLQNNQEQKLVIGYSSAASNIVPLSCGHFMASHPHIKIELQQQESKELSNRLLRGEIDISVSTEQPEIVSSSVHLPDQLVLFVSRKHPLANKLSITQSDLAEYPLYGCFSKSKQIQGMMQEAANSLHKSTGLRVGSLDEVIKSVLNSSSFALASIEHASVLAQHEGLLLLHTNDELTRQHLVIRTRSETKQNTYVVELLNEIKLTAEQLNSGQLLTQQ